MSKAAQFGHGTFTYIGKIGEVGEKMEALFTKLETPMMSHLEVRWPQSAGSVDAWPKHLPDLYSGEPVVIAARVEDTAGEVLISGRSLNGLGSGILIGGLPCSGVRCNTEFRNHRQCDQDECDPSVSHRFTLQRCDYWNCVSHFDADLPL